MQGVYTLISAVFDMLAELPVFDLGFSFLTMYFSIMIIFIICSWIRNIINVQVSSDLHYNAKKNRESRLAKQRSMRVQKKEAE